MNRLDTKICFTFSALSTANMLRVIYKNGICRERTFAISCFVGIILQTAYRFATDPRYPLPIDGQEQKRLVYDEPAIILGQNVFDSAILTLVSSYATNLRGFRTFPENRVHSLVINDTVLQGLVLGFVGLDLLGRVFFVIVK